MPLTITPVNSMQVSKVESFSHNREKPDQSKAWLNLLCPRSMRCMEDYTSSKSSTTVASPVILMAIQSHLHFPHQFCLFPLQTLALFCCVLYCIFCSLYAGLCSAQFMALCKNDQLEAFGVFSSGINLASKYVAQLSYQLLHSIFVSSCFETKKLFYFENCLPPKSNSNIP